MKPVAWAYIKDGDFFDAVHPDEHEKYEGMYTTPLYTHPVDAVNISQEYVDKTQNNRHELTDEEINLLAKAYSTMEGELNAPAFARAILRKAQEKC